MKTKANNTSGCWLYEFLQPTSQLIHIIVISLLLIYSPLVYLTYFLDSYIQAGLASCKLTTQLLLFLLSPTLRCMPATLIILPVAMHRPRQKQSYSVTLSSHPYQPYSKVTRPVGT